MHVGNSLFHGIMIQLGRMRGGDDSTVLKNLNRRQNIWTNLAILSKDQLEDRKSFLAYIAVGYG